MTAPSRTRAQTAASDSSTRFMFDQSDRVPVEHLRMAALAECPAWLRRSSPRRCTRGAPTPLSLCSTARSPAFMWLYARCSATSRRSSASGFGWSSTRTSNSRSCHELPVTSHSRRSAPRTACRECRRPLPARRRVQRAYARRDRPYSRERLCHSRPYGVVRHQIRLHSEVAADAQRAARRSAVHLR